MCIVGRRPSLLGRRPASTCILYGDCMVLLSGRRSDHERPEWDRMLCIRGILWCKSCGNSLKGSLETRINIVTKHESGLVCISFDTDTKSHAVSLRVLNCIERKQLTTSESCKETCQQFE